MTQAEIRQKIIGIIADKNLQNPEEINTEQTIEELGIDSLDVVEIIMDIEKEFGISLPTDAEEHIRTVEDFIEVSIPLIKPITPRFRYRDRNLEFRSWVSKDDVKNAEQVLIDNGIPIEGVQSVLDDLCQTLLDVHIYQEN